MKDEITRVPFDSDETWPGESYKGSRPKWQKPKSVLAIAMLDAVGRVYYQNRDEQLAVNNITRQAISMSTGILVKYPVEWIEECCAYVKGKRDGEKPIPYTLKGLITIINNDDRKNNFVLKWRADHMDIPLERRLDAE